VTNKNHPKWHHLNSDWSSSDFQLHFCWQGTYKPWYPFLPWSVDWSRMKAKFMSIYYTSWTFVPTICSRKWIRSTYRLQTY